MAELHNFGHGRQATLHQGDFAETLALCGGKADLVFCSPPYADARSYGADVSWDMPDYQRLGDEVFKALRPGGTFILNLDAPVRNYREGMGTERGLQPWRTMLDYADRVGFRVPDRLIFRRQGVPGAYPGRFRNDFEPLLWFSRPGDGSVCEASRISTPATTAGTVRRATSHGRRANGNKRYQGAFLTPEVVRRGTAWDYFAGSSDRASGDHPAPWPYKLARDIIICFSNPGDLVCDPFLGRGTSMVAALDHGRRLIGGDLLMTDPEDPEDREPWVDVAAKMAREKYRFKQTSIFDEAAA